MPAGWQIAMAGVLLAGAASGQSTDGGRSDLPGMKKDIFDEIKGSKRGGPKTKVKERAECPKSDGLSPFTAMYISKDDIYVNFEGGGEKCAKLQNIGGANISSLWAASKTCGSVGEWKRRVAEELSAIFFVGGYESWPKSENETIDVETEFGNYSVPVLAENYDTIKACWARGCRCEQANSPVLRAVLLGALVLCLAGIGNDAFKVAWANFRGKGEDKEKKPRKSEAEKKEKKEKKEAKRASKIEAEGSEPDSEASGKKEKKDKKEKKERKSRKEASEDGSDSEKKSGKDDSESGKDSKSGKDDASEKSKDDDGKDEKAQ